MYLGLEFAEMLSIFFTLVFAPTLQVSTKVRSIWFSMTAHSFPRPRSLTNLIVKKLHAVLHAYLLHPSLPSPIFFQVSILFQPTKCSIVLLLFFFCVKLWHTVLQLVVWFPWYHKIWGIISVCNLWVWILYLCRSVLGRQKL